ncbi:hypothetical protein PR202_gb16814 [Eleusine coracana subsp. coracana]|uniref:Protein kinase domain-containing protein n=1 Tax=Eleusine coracana subsp. coracana TaxID=191504 RepID=A0AAV5F122_ELECO|nr:hypothetical protein PR202_gb16756 [Eleusine coracana subsp. coracana]GJN28662.1 hypothetical protein PR202_gb16814 [Eleusine coracana subsp. coracana]
MGNETSKLTSRPQSLEFSRLEKILQDGYEKPSSLPMDFLKAITHDFSKERELGNGGFGIVYKGVLQNGKEIAVKMLRDVNLDDDQFQKEVTILYGLKHRNIVQLVGYCAESKLEYATLETGKHVMAEVRNKRFICFEYLNNKSLDEYISGMIMFQHACCTVLSSL